MGEAVAFHLSASKMSQFSLRPFNRRRFLSPGAWFPPRFDIGAARYAGADDTTNNDIY